MYDLRSLKTEVNQTERDVDCPVNGCTVKLTRMRQNDSPKDPKFMCPIHRIIVSPSTFTYDDPMKNILWKNEEDLILYNQVATVKREKFRRNGHNNSEDALSWNVFRYIEKNELHKFASYLLGKQVENPQIIYWTYDQTSKTVWKPLVEAWKMFEYVTSGHRSEPDLILKTKNDLVFIEAKFKSGNNTPIKPERAEKVRDGYVKSADNWFSEVFNNDFDAIAMVAKKYELLRFWLLGTWIAQQNGWNFTLLNLVRSRQERKIDQSFGKFLKQNDSRTFR